MSTPSRNVSSPKMTGIGTTRQLAGRRLGRHVGRRVDDEGGASRRRAGGRGPSLHPDREGRRGLAAVVRLDLDVGRPGRARTHASTSGAGRPAPAPMSTVTRPDRPPPSGEAAPSAGGQLVGGPSISTLVTAAAAAAISAALRASRPSPGSRTDQAGERRRQRAGLHGDHLGDPPDGHDHGLLGAEARQRGAARRGRVPAASGDGAEALQQLAHPRAVGQRTRPRSATGSRDARQPGGALGLLAAHVVDRSARPPSPQTAARARRPLGRVGVDVHLRPAGGRPSPARCRPSARGRPRGRRRRSSPPSTRKLVQ